MGLQLSTKLEQYMLEYERYLNNHPVHFEEQMQKLNPELKNAAIIVKFYAGTLNNKRKLVANRASKRPEISPKSLFLQPITASVLNMLHKKLSPVEKEKKIKVFLDSFVHFKQHNLSDEDKQLLQAKLYEYESIPVPKETMFQVSLEIGETSPDFTTELTSTYGIELASKPSSCEYLDHLKKMRGCWLLK